MENPVNPADLKKITEEPEPSRDGPASEVWHGVIDGFSPSGALVSHQVQVTNPSRSWVQKKLEETSNLLQRSNGFRWASSSKGKSTTILLLHPTLNCLSFELSVTRCQDPTGNPPCTGQCLVQGEKP